jgi:uncharacterized protein CbrC (UPF0167 family)
MASASGCGKRLVLRTDLTLSRSADLLVMSKIAYAYRCLHCGALEALLDAD